MKTIGIYLKKHHKIVAFMLLLLLLLVWIYWFLAVDRRLVKTLSCDGMCQTVRFSSDSKWIATGTVTGEIKIWSSENYRLNQTIHGFGENIRHITWSNDGRMIASVSWAGAVRIWNVQDGTQIDAWYVPEHSEPFRLASDETKYALDTSSGSSVAFNSDGTKLAVGFGSKGQQGKLCVFQVQPLGLDLLWQSGHKSSGQINTLAFSPDSEFLASNTFDGIRVWETSSGKTMYDIWRSSGERGPIYWSDSSQTLLAYTANDVEQWALPDKKAQITNHQLSSPRVSYAFSKDGRLAAEGGGVFGDDYHHYAFIRKPYKPWIWVWRTGDIKPFMLLRGHSDTIHALDFSPDNHLLASVSEDGTLRIWNIQ